MVQGCPWRNGDRRSLGNFFFFYAIKIAGVSLALSMMATGALITALLDPILSKRRLLGYELLFGG